MAICCTPQSCTTPKYTWNQCKHLLCGLVHVCRHLWRLSGHQMRQLTPRTPNPTEFFPVPGSREAEPPIKPTKSGLVRGVSVGSGCGFALQFSSSAVFLTIPWERGSWVRHGGAPVDRYLWCWDNEWIERCDASWSWKMSLTVCRTGNLMLLYPTSRVFPAGVRVRMTCGWRWWRLKCHFQWNGGFVCL